MSITAEDTRSTTAGLVTVRLFAAAAEAAGAEQLSVTAAVGTPLEELLGRLPEATRRGAETQAQRSEGRPDLQQVLTRCSFLINGVRSSPESGSLSPGDQLDVLPPFAGG